MKALFVIAIALVAVLFFFFLPEEKTTVGVIVPMQHEALSQIVEGLEEGLEGVSVKVVNAQGDLNIQRALIEQLKQKKTPLLVPIGTGTSEMTLNLAGPDSQVICLAAHPNILSSGMRATLLNDELSVEDSLLFIHTAFPKLKKISLVYSASEKVAAEIPLVFTSAQKYGIQVEGLMVQNATELYTVTKAVTGEAIFILKDHLVVSAVDTLARQATLLQIPLIASDEGSVIRGAACALGVKEADIGRQGAALIKEVLAGVPAEDIPFRTMQGPFPLFINEGACKEQGVKVKEVVHQAELLQIPVILVEGK